MADTALDAILVDANLLVWAHHRQFLHHERARQWLSDTMASTALVGLPWPSILAFVRVSTHHRALERPLDESTARAVVDGWLAQPAVRVPVPTERHAALFGDLLVRGRAAGNHSTDAHLAALALEWGLVLVSADRDFARYPGLRWHDPTDSW
ncbi:MAG: PIN domain-containing protein [Actinomycetota bacterium]|nr:PIN domain-containing protein [Actinomycetota bacterium]MDQ3350842.1 PIN domain-containing protein [Actinomycetota bacterium]